MPIEAGKNYVLINKTSGTALDLDTRDNRSVQGWVRHGRANQQVRMNSNLAPSLRVSFLTFPSRL
jgi:hypothetical protein